MINLKKPSIVIRDKRMPTHMVNNCYVLDPLINQLRTSLYMYQL